MVALIEQQSEPDGAVRRTAHANTLIKHPGTAAEWFKTTIRFVTMFCVGGPGEPGEALFIDHLIASCRRAQVSGELRDSLAQSADAPHSAPAKPKSG